ncbi:MAG: hypothetical protein KUA43_15635 [Hoeflea sp.]|uniref:hypothetical protein n=1 Tax=Hoeflea sp. TaxID=1940281 RepID=UPI001E01C397|nr:hypothetical protein [Hoeflea sp.]MBU4531594.1 hypothetical protein [Alphaproteobacteria bacterium]MBU4544451.1 hypothetical protein [Alphaproteobacteria bacterium]MBU4550312.1 hypothetical protein [Alphaproteobacteria bacterium]MBV1724870.1 hypothetical protein [Hoeflea sp.]MBV1760890.1 hypothetical protein [Hoeflea sp.]
MNTIARIASRFRLLVLAGAIATLAACQSGSSGSTAASSSERPATVAEIEAVAVGNTINNAMTYNTDGTYLFRGGNPGRYTISRGRICVTFNSGGRRCDRIVHDGGSLVMINRDGKRFPFG